MLASIVALALVFINLVTLHAQPSRYNVTLLDSLGPNAYVSDINNLGDMVGYYTDYAEKEVLPFIYTNGKILSIGPSSIGPTGINDSKQISAIYISKTSDKTEAVLCEFGEGGISYKYLGTIGGKEGSSEANAINNLGVIVGSSSATLDSTNYAVIFSKDTIIQLGTLYPGGYSYALGINDNTTSSEFGEIVGVASTPYVSGEWNPGDQAFLYSNNKIQNLDYVCPDGYTRSSQTGGINNFGQIAVACFSSSENYLSFFIYDSINGNYESIGQNENALAMDINDVGQIIGTANNYETPFLYMNSILYNLYSLLPTNSDLTGLYPIAINNRGQIAATTDQGVVLLTPINDEGYNEY